ncbi:hypothetical protein V8D89_008395 [Ganoderma adspersum]
MFVDNLNAEETIAIHSLMTFENYCILASSTLLWFDIALTFPTEVRRIWGRRFSGATLVYLFTRYTALAHQALFVTQALLVDSSDQTCGRISHLADVLITLNILSISAFTILGVYGVWGPDWKPLSVVVLLTLIKPALVIYKNTHYTPTQGGAPLGCFADYSLSNATLSTVAQIEGAMTIPPNAILICLTWVKTLGIHKALSEVGIRTSLTTLLLRDGTAFLMILLLSRTVVIVSRYYIRFSNTEATLLLVWPYFDQVLSPILLSRFLLNACGLPFANRKSHVSSTISASSFEMPEIRFNASRVLGNLGGTLSNPAPPEDSSDVETCRAHPCKLDIEEAGRDGLRGITESTLSRSEMAP